ncbi:MAG: peptide deformylase [Candidatus Dormibacteraceae bacterium]
MAIRKILTADQPVLRQKCKKIARVDAATIQLLEELTETMFAAHGAGLAAPQIGVPLRAFVVRGDDNQIHALVNPEIIRAEGSQVGYEGCLSIPGYVGEVERAESVRVTGINRKGKWVRIKATGHTSRALQHEADHLDGILYIDKLTSLETLKQVPPREGEQLESTESEDKLIELETASA